MKKIFEFPVLYTGWECDGKGWIVEGKNGKRRILLTSHGMEYFGSQDELGGLISEYQSAIDKTREVLALLS